MTESSEEHVDELMFWPTLVALVLEFATLPRLIGGKTAGGLIGWPMIMAIFFGIPSTDVYALIFAAFGVTSPPAPVVSLWRS